MALCRVLPQKELPKNWIFLLASALFNGDKYWGGWYDKKFARMLFIFLLFFIFLYCPLKIKHSLRLIRCPIFIKLHLNCSANALNKSSKQLNKYLLSPHKFCCIPLTELMEGSHGHKSGEYNLACLSTVLRFPCQFYVSEYHREWMCERKFFTRNVKCGLTLSSRDESGTLRRSGLNIFSSACRITTVYLNVSSLVSNRIVFCCMISSWGIPKD